MFVAVAMTVAITGGVGLLMLAVTLAAFSYFDGRSKCGTKTASAEGNAEAVMGSNSSDGGRQSEC